MRSARRWIREPLVGFAVLALLLITAHRVLSPERPTQPSTAVVAAMDHVVELVGDAHVALGSDYDGGTTVGFDTSELPVLTQVMLDAGYSDARVRRILGGNALRVMREVLPAAAL